MLNDIALGADAKWTPPPQPMAGEDEVFDPSNPAHVELLKKRQAFLQASGAPASLDPKTGAIVGGDNAQQPGMSSYPEPAPGPVEKVGGALKFGTAVAGAVGDIAASKPMPMGGGGGGYGLSYSGDKANFGKTPHQIADEKLTADHLRTMGGLDKEGAAQAVAGEEEKAATFAAHYQKVQELEAKRLEAEKQRQFWVNSALEKHQQEAEALSKAEIDPNHWWSSKGTGDKIMAGIGMALVAFGAGLSAAGGGDSTMGMKAIQNTIDRDIAVQKANIENKWAGLKTKQGLYAARLQAFQDERVAEASAKASAWELVGMKIRSMEAKTSSEMAKTQARKLGEQADFMVDHYKNQVATNGELAYLDWQKRMAAAAGSASKQDKEDDDAARKYIYEKRGLGPNEEVRRNPQTGKLAIVEYLPGGKMAWKPIGGTPGGSPIGSENKKITPVNTPFKLPNGAPIVVNAPNPEMATKMAKGLDGAMKFRNAIKRMIELDAANKGTWTGSDLTKYKAAHAMAEVGFKDIFDLGALDVGVERMTDKALPGVPTWGVGKNFDSDREMLQEMLRASDEIINNTIERYGDQEASVKIPKPLQKKPVE